MNKKKEIAFIYFYLLIIFYLLHFIIKIWRQRYTKFYHYPIFSTLLVIQKSTIFAA